MQYRTLGASGIQVSEIGFGAWGIGGWGQRDDEEARRALQHAFDLGITFYDTAMGYGNGHSERLIGEAFKDQRNQVVIASKISPKTKRWPVTANDPVSATFPAEWIVTCTENSLKNLGTDYLDVQQLHAWADAYTQADEWLEGFRRLKEAGKVRAFGVSVNDWDAYGGTNLARSGLVDSIQVIYNIFEQRPEEQLFPAALEGKTGIIVRVPFEEGLLTGALKPGYEFPRGDWRADWLAGGRLEDAYQRVQALNQYLDPQQGVPDLAVLALKFCLAHPAVSTVIPGMRKRRHVEANVQASDGKPLAEATVQALHQHAFVHGWQYPWAA